MSGTAWPQLVLFVTQGKDSAWFDTNVFAGELWHTYGMNAHNVSHLAFIALDKHIAERELKAYGETQIVSMVLPFRFKFLWY